MQLLASRATPCYTVPVHHDHGDTDMDAYEYEDYEEDEGYHCWVCDAIANPILDENGEWTGGTDCGCDDMGYGDGPGHAWER
jgi:hypothetical protein